MNHSKAQFLARAAMTAAIYVVLTYLFAPFSFSEIQVRISEALTILPLFTPAAIPGLFVGCLVGNMLGGALLPDIIFGSIATLLGAIGTYLLRTRIKETQKGWRRFAFFFVALLPPVIANAIIVPLVLRYAYGILMPIPLMVLTVGAGELISCVILGYLLYNVLYRYRKILFLDQSF